MATVFFSKNLTCNEKNIAWEAKNGATRKHLLVINKLGVEIPADTPIKCDLGVLDKNGKAYIFINPSKKEDSRILGVFICGSYGYTVKQGEELFVASSVGGYGNSESKMGIYTVGTVLAVHSYKNRSGDAFYVLTEKGWEELPDDSFFENEITII